MNDYTSQYSPQDIQRSRGISILCYIGILVLFPLFLRKDSPFTRFHCNQGLILLCVEVLFYTLQTALNFLLGLVGLWFLKIPVNFVFAVLSILCLTLLVIGVMNASGGRAKELPIIGKIRLIR